MSLYNITTGETLSNIPNGEIFLSISNPINNACYKGTFRANSNSLIKSSIKIINQTHPHLSYKSDSILKNHDSKIITITNNTSSIRNGYYDIFKNKFIILDTNTYNLSQNIQPVTWAPSYPIRVYL